MLKPWEVGINSIKMYQVNSSACEYAHVTASRRMPSHAIADITEAKALLCESNGMRSAIEFAVDAVGTSQVCKAVEFCLLWNSIAFL